VISFMSATMRHETAPGKAGHQPSIVLLSGEPRTTNHGPLGRELFVLF
jgi:hypothetical protein